MKTSNVSPIQKTFGIFLLFILLILMSFVCLFVGSSNMSPADVFAALFKQSSPAFNRIIWNIRLPRIIAAVVAGAGLSVSGLIMQTCLNNVMASPSTLGVSNAAVFGANLAIIAGASVFLNPFAVSFTAFIFSMLSIFLILVLCKIKAYTPNVVILSGIALGAIWTAATTVLQFYATDVGLSAAVIWNFGDLGRATYKIDLIMTCIVGAGIVLFYLLSWKFNALLSGDAVAISLGININLIRFVSMVMASMITAVCVSFLGVIGFVGVICPHAVKKLLGQDHRFSIPASALAGAFLLIVSDTVSRSMGKGSALPVGAITSLLGAPFFISLIFSKENSHNA